MNALIMTGAFRKNFRQNSRGFLEAVKRKVGTEWGQNQISHRIYLKLTGQHLTYNILFSFMVPGAGIEPAQPQGPRDFKSLIFSFINNHKTALYT
jgi:hypothetical protein